MIVLYFCDTFKTYLNIMTMTVNSLKAKINALQGEIAAIEAGKVNNNIAPMTTAVRNFEDCVGSGYVAGDYYAPQRYYVEGVPGVKNIRWDDKWVGEQRVNYLRVKVTSPAGYLLPEKICGYDIVFDESKNFDTTLDY